jgi:ABC-type multidrug transport system fused ATPase/permease subunit
VISCTRLVVLFPTDIRSLERIQAYLEIDHEPKPSAAGVPPAAWPTSGELQVEKMSARYSVVCRMIRHDYMISSFLQSGPKVLHDISFHVKSGERIGIGIFYPCRFISLNNHFLVGRTGSGKVSIYASTASLTVYIIKFRVH